MSEDTVFNSTNKGTLRPNEDLLRSKGDEFKPMELPNQGWEVTFPNDVSPDDLITLFTLYYTPEIIDLIVKKTNEYVRRPKDESCPRARAKEQYPTCCREMSTL